MEFSPVINKEDFSCFWSTGTAWGIFKQKKCAETGKLEYSVDVLYGKLDNVEITAGGIALTC